MVSCTTPPFYARRRNISSVMLRLWSVTARALEWLAMMGACDTAMALLDKLDGVNKALEQLAAEHDLPALSMGMSSDYETAILCGATHVRVGTALFGARG